MFLSVDYTSSLLKKRSLILIWQKSFSVPEKRRNSYSIDTALKSFEENDIEYCAIATDGSNHDGLKLFSVLVQYLDWKNGVIQSKMIEFMNMPNQIADTIVEYYLRKKQAG